MPGGRLAAGDSAAIGDEPGRAQRIRSRISALVPPLERAGVNITEEGGDIIVQRPAKIRSLASAAAVGS